MDLALPNNLTSLQLTYGFTNNAYVREYDTQALATTQPVIVGNVFDPSLNLVVGGTLAPTLMSSDGTTVAWDGLADDNVTTNVPLGGHVNGDLDVFLHCSGPDRSDEHHAEQYDHQRHLAGQHHGRHADHYRHQYRPNLHLHADRDQQQLVHHHRQHALHQHGVLGGHCHHRADYHSGGGCAGRPNLLQDAQHHRQPSAAHGHHPIQHNGDRLAAGQHDYRHPHDHGRQRQPDVYLYHRQRTE